MVEALVCTKDWVAASRKGSQKCIPSIVGDLEVMETLAAIANMGEEDLDSDDDD
ncbi:hypothetical protein OROHE_024714 [Orobanche hederae]